MRTISLPIWRADAAVLGSDIVVGPLAVAPCIESQLQSDRCKGGQVDMS